jgi:hypothetical protein
MAVSVSQITTSLVLRPWRRRSAGWSDYQKYLARFSAVAITVVVQALMNWDPASVISPRIACFNW